MPEALEAAGRGLEFDGRMETVARLKLYGMPGWGSALVEAQLNWYGLEYDFERVGDLFKSEQARKELEKVNPLGQIPVLMLENGTVMTESAAITLYLADSAQGESLVPGQANKERAAFLRWLIFIVANIYPTYTYADDPARFVAEPGAQQGFKQAVDDYARKLYKMLEAEVGGKWFLGDRFSALDIYICVMTRWRPSRAWFAEHAPRLFAIASAVEEVEKLKACWAKNFSES